MPKAYKVGDTTYRFPDDYDDARVQSILTEQGVIKAAPDRNELPGYQEAKAFIEEQEKRGKRGWGEAFKEAVSQIGQAIVSPIAGIPAAVEEVSNFVASGGRPPVLNPDGTLRPTGVYAENPVNQALGNAVGIAAIPAAAAIPGVLRAGARKVSTAAQNPTVRAVGRAAVESVPVAGPLATGVYDAVQAAKKANTPPPAAGALPVEMPAPAAPGPVALSAGEAAQMPPRVAMDSLMKRGAAVPDPIPEAPIPPAPEWAQGLTPGQWKALSRSGHSEVVAKAIAERLSGGRPAIAPIEAPAPEPLKVVSIRPPRGKGVAQASKDARVLADKLTEWNFTPDEAAAMNERGWAKLAHDTGVPMPTAATQKSAVFALKKKLAGPERTIPEMLDSLRKDLGMKPSAREIAEALKAEMEK